jgi:Flagellar transcriptional activator (FlhC)
MRITDDRYSRDRLKLDLALRLLRHEARTCTIQHITGLSGDRIRKLYRAYLQQDSTRRLLRHRGKAPSQPQWFLRNAEVRRQAAVLGGLFGLCGLLDPMRDATAPTLLAGEMFCRAYETYLREHAEACISFDHAWCLLLTLRRQQGLQFAQCPRCDTLGLVDRLKPATATCGWCSPGRRPRTH